MAATADVICKHGDRMCPCNDGSVCNYEYDPVSDTKGAPCRNPLCPTCQQAATA